MQRVPNYRKICLGLLGALALLPVSGPMAQVSDTLPPQPGYIGEIRRGPDGKLMALPDSPKAAGNGEPEAVRKTTMIVGPGQRISSLTEASKLAKAGDVIEIRPGNYRGQPAVWTQDNLTIRGAGERPVMIADGKSAEDKAIWVVRASKVRIENIEFRGSRVSHGNGAGIRFEQGSLVIHGCAFFDNEMGVLTANNADMSLEVLDSEFGAAPHHEGQLHHLLYVGAIDRFVLRGSRFSSGYLGHLVKSRARESHVLYNMLVDGKDGRASYELEFPNGGLAYVIGNVIGQSAGTDNPSMVSYGAEGPRWPENGLYLTHNTLINDHHAGDFLKVWTEKFAAGIDVWAINNLTVGNGNFFRPAQGRFEGNSTAGRAELIEYGGVPSRLANLSPLRGSVRLPGQVGREDLMPRAEFTFPVGSRQLRLSNALSPGAFQ